MASSPGKSRKKDGMEPPMPIAIVGMACRLPGDVSDLESCWDFCHAARNSWTEFPKERLSTAAFQHPNPEKAGCFRLKGAHFLKDIASFDASFFNITADEAKSVDPRHRLLLECTYEAFENSGIPISSLAGQDVGVFVGGSLSHYELHCLRDYDTAPRLQYIGCADSLLANRISYFFDLRGPSATIDTACSSGLTALHLACQSLRAGEVSQAVVGGSHLNLMPEVLASVSSAMFYSEDGKCFPFDERVSGGFGPGEGTSCLVLKPLQDAIEAGDNIRAVIRNSGMNQDGKTVGISMPSSDAQAALIRSVYESAGLDPTDTKYVEAHGTGTTVGDPLEAAAFAATFATKASSEDPIFIGSVKSNFGHLEGVSGIVSVIKAAMMLEKGVILPNANFKTPNPKITSLGRSLKVPTSATDWSSSCVRRASINNLGFGGSNAHVILEEFPPVSDRFESTTALNGTGCENRNGVVLTSGSHGTASYRLYVLTGNDDTAVKSQMDALKSYLKKRSDTSTTDLMASLAFTLGQRRSLLPWRIALAASTADGLVGQLGSLGSIPNRAAKQPKLGFVFTGQGANWHAMGRELFQSYTVFSSVIMAVDKHLESLGAPWSLVEELSKDAKESLLRQAHISQPACTAIQIALVQLLESWGVRPHAVVGHSSGEIAAAFAAGALTLESCMTIAYYRGLITITLKEKFPNLKGAMLAVGTGHEEAASMMDELQHGQVVVACFNSPSSITASGDARAITELREAAEKKNLFSRKLPVDVAYHSPHMDLIAEEYRKAMGNIKPAVSKNVHFFSSLIGRKISTLALGGYYWMNNLKSPVLFSDALLGCCFPEQEGSIPEDSVTHLIEVGPHSALKGPIRDVLGAVSKTKNKIGYSSTLLRNENAVISTLNLASELFMKGCHLDMSAINCVTRGESKPKVLSDLPPYPWNHKNKYWHESRISQGHRMKPRPRNDILGTLAADSNDLEPRWRNIICLDEIPWLRDHRIRSNCVFPFAGYVAMAVEAESQRAQSRNLTYSKIDLREVSNSQPLIILEGVDVEMLLTLRPFNESTKASSETWDEFRVFSWTDDAGWTEHCRGQIAALNDRKPNDVEGEHPSDLARSAFQDQICKVETSCVSPIESRRMYEAVSNIGIDYGPCLAKLSDCRVGGDHAVGLVEVPDTASTMPHQSETRQVIHPAVLDNCIQLVWPLMGAGRTELEGLYLPNSVKNLCIRPNTRIQSGDHVRVLGTLSGIPSSSDCCVESLIMVDPNDADQPPYVTIDELVLVSLSDATPNTEKREKLNYSKVHWEPCLDLLGPKEFQDHFRLGAACDSESQITRVLEQASVFYFETALQTVTDAHYDLLQEHHKKFYRLMQKQSQAAKNGKDPFSKASWDSMSDSECKNLPDRMRTLGVDGEMISKIGEKISEIMLNGLDALSLMLEDGLLGRYYRHSVPSARNNVQAAMVVNVFAHENPSLRVLEIGAGTGGVTLPILETLGGVMGRVPRFQDYVFTDVSTGLFEKAQEMLKSWGSLVTFRGLNIEEDPVSQGYEAGAFDLVIAANDLHATTRMTRTLQNVCKLLKPGGKLLLIENTTPRAPLFLFSLIPGRWAGEEENRTNGPLLEEQQWDSLLKQTGFSGVDRSLQEYPGEEVQSHSVILSTVTAAVPRKISKDLIIIHSHQSNRMSLDVLKEHLSTATGRVPRIVRLSEIVRMDVKDSHCIFLDELLQPMLADISAIDFEAIQSLCSAAGLLWVVQGAQMEASSPESSMAIGLTRSIRSENPTIRLVTLDLDERQQLSASRTSQVIAKLYLATFTTETETSTQHIETEYSERNGCLYIPRVVQDPDMNQCIKTVTQKPVPDYQTYLEADRAVTLKIETPGFLDTLYFANDDSINLPMSPDDVEIQVKASALNFRDVMVALGKMSLEKIGSDCSGVITAVGSNVSDLVVGDRVCAMAAGAFSTLLRCAAPRVVRIPDTTHYADAATLPVICTTVYHSIVNVAGLCSGESILIHAAAGGVGQTAIMLSQNIGAEIYATVGSVRKKELIMSKYGIREDHIFSSRDMSFEDGILNMTGKKGVDVALNSLSGDALRATWRCLAHFGRMVEIGKTDLLANGRLEMLPFIHNRSYAAVDMLSIASEKPSLMKKLLLQIIDLHRTGVFKPVFPVTTFPYSEMESAFRTMQSGNNVGKIVLLPQREDRVKIMPRKVALSALRTDATYLITGGSGGLGHSFARWLADHGARYIILASRSAGTDPKTRKLIEELHDRVMIVARSCDVTLKHQVERLVTEGATQMPPIRGVIHGTMDDRSAFFENYTVEDYMAVIRPKVHGAWNLHHVLLHHRLDFFVSIASATGVIGNHGQSAYCATTTFLDAFASYRASLGLAASTIDLGAVTDIGYLAEHRPDLHMPVKTAMGAEIREAELLTIIDAAVSGRIGKASNHHSITGLACTGNAAQNFWTSNPRFSHLRVRNAKQRDAAAVVGTANSVRHGLLEAPSLAAARKLVYDGLAAKFSTVLRIDEEDLGADRALGAYGTDSLVAVELRNWITREMEATVMLVDMLADSTLATLTETVGRKSKLCERLRLQQQQQNGDGEAKG